MDSQRTRRRSARDQRSRDSQRRQHAFTSEPGYPSASSDDEDIPNYYPHVSPRHQNASSNEHMYGTLPSRNAHSRHYEHPQYWHTVSRPWETVNPDAYRTTQDRALNRSPFAVSPNAQTSHSHSSIDPRSAASAHPPALSRSGEGGASAPRPELTMSSLASFDDGRTSTTNMDMWMRQDRRDGAYDGLGHVRREQADSWNRRSNGY